MVGSPLVIPSDGSSGGLSRVWAEAFLRSMERGNSEFGPLTATITEFGDSGPIEIPAIRDRLDTELRTHGIAGGCTTVANTIFPMSLWNPSAADDAEQLFSRYNRLWPRIQRANPRGTYFRRLTAFAPKGQDGEAVNQLRHVIDTHRDGNHRRSALIACIFDPTRDHSDCRQQGFPCMQQVSFAPLGDNELMVTAVYVTQFLFPRAYGNYLGLCRLGQFVAKHMNRRLTRVNCIATIAMRGGKTKVELEGLAGHIRGIMSLREGAEPCQVG
jgi:hypothetical protein